MATKGELHSYSPRIVGAELPKEGRPILIRNYKVSDVGIKDYRIILSGMQNPFVQIDWPRKNGMISKELAEVLGVETHMDVSTNADPDYFEGLRTLIWGLGYHRGPFLLSGWEPWFSNFNGGSLLVSAAEGDGRIKIPGVGYVQPEIALREKDLFETQLYVEENSLVNSSANDLNAIARFVEPKEPDMQWLESEVERFKHNGENLSKSKLIDLYKQLREHIWKKYWVRSREILAWPVMLAEEDSVEVPRSNWEKIQQLYKELGTLLQEQ